MSRLQKLRVFVSQRLDAAVSDILSVLEKTIVKYEQEAALSQEVISRQHALLCALHKPHEELPSPDVFTQQLLSSKLGPSEDQDQEDQDPPEIITEIQDLDETEIIQFTYSSRPGSTRIEPEPAGLDLQVQLVSSETEDSDDYTRDHSKTRPAHTGPKTKRGRKPGTGLRCRICSRTFKARRFLLRHAQTHLQGAELVCAMCGEHSGTSESLKIHIQTHITSKDQAALSQTRTTEHHTNTTEHQTRTTEHLTRTTKNQTRVPADQRKSWERQKSERDQSIHQNQSRTRSRERLADIQVGQRDLSCEDCGRSFLQVSKKRNHKCVSWRRNRDRSKT